MNYKHTLKETGGLGPENQEELLSPSSNLQQQSFGDMHVIEETAEAYDAANTYQDQPKEAVRDLDEWEKMHFGIEDDESDNEGI